MRRFASIWMKSMAKRSGTLTVPSKAMAAPRWEVMVAQQPFTTTQPGPRSGGSSRTAGCLSTSTRAPSKVILAGIPSAGSTGVPVCMSAPGVFTMRSVVSRCAIACGTGTPGGRATSRNTMADCPGPRVSAGSWPFSRKIARSASLLQEARTAPVAASTASSASIATTRLVTFTTVSS